MLRPDAEALDYIPDLNWLGKLRALAHERFWDAQLDLSGCREKVRKLIENHIRADGVDIILPAVPILSKKFAEQVAARGVRGRGPLRRHPGQDAGRSRSGCRPRGGGEEGRLDRAATGGPA